MVPDSPFTAVEAPESPEEQQSVAESPATGPARIQDWEARSFLNRPPHWLVRSGASLVLALLLLTILLSAFIRYPAVVKGEALLVGDNPVAPVVARAAGNLSLVAENGASVSKGDPLGFVGGSGDPTLISELKGLLGQGESVLHESDRLPSFDGSNERLGQVHGPYVELGKAHREWREFDTDPFPATHLATLLSQITKEETQVENRRRAIEPLKAERVTAGEQLARLAEALERGSISRVRYDEQQSSVLSLDRQIQEALAGLTSAGLSLERSEQAHASYVQEQEERSRNLRNQLRVGREATVSAIKEWENLHLLSAPATGTLSLYDFWSDGQHVAAGTHVLSVIPEAGSVRAHVRVPGQGAGRIEAGQEVVLKLADFPSREFGWLTGEVVHVSGEAREGKYMVVAELPGGLETHTGHQLVYRSGLSGEGRVITRHMSILSRVLAGLRGMSF